MLCIHKPLLSRSLQVQEFQRWILRLYITLCVDSGQLEKAEGIVLGSTFDVVVQRLCGVLFDVGSFVVDHAEVKVGTVYFVFRR